MKLLPEENTHGLEVHHGNHAKKMSYFRHSETKLVKNEYLCRSMCVKHHFSGTIGESLLCTTTFRNKYYRTRQWFGTILFWACSMRVITRVRNADERVFLQSTMMAGHPIHISVQTF